MAQALGRISKKHDFNQIFEQGKRFYYLGLGLQFLEKKGEPPRLAIIISRATEKSAVRRNRIRRRIREICRQKSGFIAGDFIFVVKKDATKDLFFQLEHKILNLLKKAQP